LRPACTAWWHSGCPAAAPQIGIRAALGAQRSDILALILREAVLLVSFTSSANPAHGGRRRRAAPRVASYGAAGEPTEARVRAPHSGRSDPRRIKTVSHVLDKKLSFVIFTAERAKRAYYFQH